MPAAPAALDYQPATRIPQHSTGPSLCVTPVQSHQLKSSRAEASGSVALGTAALRLYVGDTDQHVATGR